MSPSISNLLPWFPTLQAFGAEASDEAGDLPLMEAPNKDGFERSEESDNDLLGSPIGSIQGLWRWGAKTKDIMASKMVDLTAFVSIPILAKVTIDDFHAIESLPTDIQSQVWEASLDQLESEGMSFPREQVASYDDFPAYLKKYGIEFPERIQSLRTALILTEARDKLMDPDHADELGQERPLLVMIGAKDDHNGAMCASQFPTVDTLVKSGCFDVLYFELGTDYQADNILEKVHEKTGHRIHTIVFDGHGTRQSIQLGKPGSGEEGDVDVGDFQDKGYFGDLDKILEPDGQILLLGCSNGASFHSSKTFLEQLNDAGQELEWFLGLRHGASPLEEIPESERYNLAETFSRAAPGRLVYASRKPMNIRSLSIDPQTLRPSIEWTTEAPFVAQAGLVEYFDQKEKTMSAMIRREADRRMMGGPSAAVARILNK